MKKLPLILVSLVVLLCLGCTQQQELERQVAEAEQTIVEKEQENAELQTALAQINTALLNVQDTLQTEQARNDAFSSRIVELELENSRLLGRVSALENTEIENAGLQGRISGLEAEAETQAGVLSDLRVQISQKEQSLTAAEARIATQRLLIADILGERSSLVQSIQNLTAPLLAESDPTELAFSGTTNIWGSAKPKEYFEVELGEYQALEGSYSFREPDTLERSGQVRILNRSNETVWEGSGDLARFFFAPEEPGQYVVEITVFCGYHISGCTNHGVYSLDVIYTILTDPPDESAFRTIPVCSTDSAYQRQPDGNWTCQES